MNRLYRFGSALCTVGQIGAFVSFLALVNSYALPALFWWSLAAVAVCGVVAGTGYVIQHTFDETPPRSGGAPSEESAAGP